MRDFFIPPNFAEPAAQLRRHVNNAPSDIMVESLPLSVEWLTDFVAKFRQPAIGFKTGSKAHQRRAIKAWSQVARDWQTMKFRGAKNILATLAAATGFSPKMLQEALFNHFVVCHEGEMAEWLEAVKRERERSPERRVNHPALVFLVNAGNIPGVAIHPVIQLSLLGIPTIVKNASAEPFLLPAILTTLAQYDPVVASRCAALTWSRSEPALTETVLQGKPALAAFGDDDTIAHFAQQKKRFADFGDRFSLALVNPAHDKPLPNKLAYDVCMFEQMGCLSPQAILFVTDDWRQVEAFCTQLAAAMEKISRHFPAGKRTPAQSAVIQQWRGALAVRAAAGEKIILLTGSGTDWTVAAAEQFDLNERVAYRFARVWPAPTLAPAVAIVRQHQAKLQSLALGFSYEELRQIALDFPDLVDGFPKILRPFPGFMQRPEFGWLEINDEWKRLTTGLRREAGV